MVQSLIGFFLGVISVYSVLLLYNMYLKHRSTIIIAQKEFDKKFLISVDSERNIYVSCPDLDIYKEILYDIERFDDSDDEMEV